MAGECTSYSNQNFGAPTDEVRSAFSRMDATAQAAITSIDALLSEGDDFKSGWTKTDIPNYDYVDILGFNDLAAPGLPPVIGTAVLPEGNISSLGNLSVYSPSFSSAPVFSVPDPVINDPERPNIIEATRPSEKPTPTPYSVPAAPDIDGMMPSVPVLSELSHVSIPDIVLPTFSGVAPVQNIPDLSASFDYTEDPYSSALLDKVTAWVSTTLDGGTGMPEAIWNRITSRLLNAIEEENDRITEDVTYESAAKGFTTPPGALSKRKRRAGDTANKNRVATHRDIAIEQARMEVEQLKHYTNSAIALEQLTIGLHNAVMDRRLRVAELSVELAVRIVEAKVAIYNAQLAQYQVEAEVYKSLIQAEMLRLEKYRIQIENERAKGDNNKLRVETYLAQIEGVKAHVSLYNSQVDGVSKLADFDRNKVQTWVAEIEGYKAEIEAGSLDWQRYETQWRGELAKVGIYEAQTRAFGAKIDAYSARVNAENVKVNASATDNRIQLDAHLADTDRYVKEMQANVEKIRADSAQYGIYGEVYRSWAAYNSTKAQAYQAQLGAAIEQARAAASVSLDGARIAAAEIQAQRAMAERAWEAQMTVNGQLASAAMAAQSVSASISASNGYSVGQSSSCSEVFSTSISG